MKLLLDTNALLWFVTNHHNLTQTAKQALADPNNQRIVSIVSLWEITIKVSIGKLSIATPFDTFVNQHLAPSQVYLLPIEISHLIKLFQLAAHHRDPFDRLLIAQASADNLTIVSADTAFDAYSVT